MPDTTLDKIKKTEAGFKSLWARMDEAAKLAYLDPYLLKDHDGKEIPQTVSVTMNDPAVFANAIAAILMSAVWQTTVEGGISAKQSRLIENFLDDSELEALQYFPKPGISAPFQFHCNHICVRGWIGDRWLWVIRDGKLYADWLPLDMRYFSYERGENGLDWGCYHTWRSQASIEKTYPGFKVSPSQSLTEIEVRDYWDGNVNEIWIQDKMVLTQPNPFGKPPFVIQPAPAGFMLLDKGYMVHEGEDIFFLDRGLYPELNRLMSIDQTLAMKAIMPPYQKQVADMAGEPAPYPGGIGEVNEVLPNEKFELIPQPDINTASRVAHQNIAGAVQRGGVNNIDLGNVTQTVSAVWITEQTEIRNKLISPRLGALAKLREQRERLKIEQFVKLGLTDTAIGKRGRKRSYSVAGLGNTDNYDISFRLMSKSKKQEIANLAMAAAARDVLSEETTIRDILMSDDPEGELARLKAERAERADPVIALFRMACALADEAEELEDEEAEQKKIESMMMTERVVALIRQRNTPQVPEKAPQPQERKPNAQPLIPLLGQGGMRTAAKATEGE